MRVGFVIEGLRECLNEFILVYPQQALRNYIYIYMSEKVFVVEDMTLI